MAFQSIWYFTDLPAKIVDTIEDDLKVKFDPHLELSKVGGGGGGVVDTGIRNERNMYGTMFREQIVRTFCMI